MMIVLIIPFLTLEGMFCYIPFQILKNNIKIRYDGTRTTAKVISSKEYMMIDSQGKKIKSRNFTTFIPILFILFGICLMSVCIFYTFN